MVMSRSGGRRMSAWRSLAAVSPVRTPTVGAVKATPEPLGGQPDAGQRRPQVLLDVERQGAQRRDVQDPGRGAPCSGTGLVTSRSMAGEERGERLAAARRARRSACARRRRWAASPGPGRAWARGRTWRTRPAPRARTAPGPGDRPCRHATHGVSHGSAGRAARSAGRRAAAAEPDPAVSRRCVAAAQHSAARTRGGRLGSARPAASPGRCGDVAGVRGDRWRQRGRPLVTSCDSSTRSDRSTATTSATTPRRCRRPTPLTPRPRLRRQPAGGRWRPRHWPDVEPAVVWTGEELLVVGGTRDDVAEPGSPPRR